MRTFQRAALFPDFTVLENVMVARHINADASLFKAIFGRKKNTEAHNIEKSKEIIEFLGLSAETNNLAV